MLWESDTPRYLHNADEEQAEAFDWIAVQALLFEANAWLGESLFLTKGEKE